jgi:hypothetical protein
MNEELGIFANDDFQSILDIDCEDRALYKAHSMNIIDERCGKRLI